ncbi:Cyclic nucleotide-binding-like [Phytophthora cactorum]|nr:Cyclic nucleotide-binding-like [Phytophthora cactorum]
MKPSFSPTRVTIDADSGRPRFDDDGDVVLRALSLSPGASRRPFDATPAPSSCSSLQLLLQGVVHAVLAGVVVSIGTKIAGPVMIGFATMIFSHPDFSETLPMLTSWFSHPVQDTGMIFLASMASSIMTELGSTVPLERIATVLVHLSISTMLVGVGLILTGKAKLASLVQYLPTPVIGGYLAYVGFFMVKGGVSLLRAYTLDDTRAAGFLEDNGAGVPVMEVYELFDLNHIHWSVMPAQLPTMLSMFVMIAFASSLDIASICMGTTSSMNYNAQLQTVGMSNLVSGLTGGYTGSYIFSQTLFTSRFRPSAAAESRFPGITRLVGVTLAACEFAIVMTPVSLMAIVPKFLFGAVMIFIGIDLLKTWLLGLATGITLAATSFLVEYAKVQDVRIVHKTSNAIRNADQHALLYGANSMSGDAESRQQDAIVTIELQGHIFFGSATRIQNCVKSAVYFQLRLHCRPTRQSLSLLSHQLAALYPEGTRGRVRPGCIFGDMDFMLEQPRVLDATSTATDTLTASFTRKKMVELRQGHPELALLLHEILLRASYMTLAEKLHSLAI